MIESPHTLPAVLSAAAADGFPLGQLVMIVLAVMALTVVMLSTHRRIRRSSAVPVRSAGERIAAAAERNAAARDLESVMLELDQLSRGIHGRLDTKLARLEVLIGDADRRIEQLAAMNDVPPPEGLDVLVGDEPAPHGDVPQPADAEPPPDRHELIHDMADRGASVIDIARKVAATPGEVELVLALRRTKDAAISEFRG